MNTRQIPYNISRPSQIGKPHPINVTAATAAASGALGWAVGFYAPPVPAVVTVLSAAGVYGLYLALTVAYDLWQARALKRERASLIAQYADAKAKRQKTRQGHVYARLRAINAKLLRGA